MEVRLEESYCLFHNDNGAAEAGGCTKEWLDDNGGDPSKLFYGGSKTAMSNEDAFWDGVDPVDFSGYPVNSIEVGMVGFVEALGAGALASGITGHYKVTAVNGDQVTFGGVTPLTIEDVISVSGSNIYGDFVEDTTVYPGGKIVLSGSDNDGEILTVVYCYDTYIEVEETLTTKTAAMSLAIATTIHVGGAYADLQDALDEADANEVDCWVLVNSDYDSPLTTAGTSFAIDSTGDGSYTNNSRLYITGYKSNCWDSIPKGYFPSQTEDGMNYVAGLEWAKQNHSDADIATKLVKFTQTAGTGYRNLFANSTGQDAQNVYLMGLYFELNDNAHVFLATGNSPVVAGCHIRHCVTASEGYDASPAADNHRRMIYVTGDSVGGEVYDCFGKGVSPVSGTDTEHASYYEVHENCFLHMPAMSEGGGSGHFHHNIVTQIWIGIYISFIAKWTVNNNTFYDVDRRVIAMDSNSVGDLYFYNADSTHKCN